MRKLLSVSVVCVMSVAVQSFAAPVVSVPLGDGFFDSEYSAGSGAETAYFVVDFGGNGGGIHGYVYHWNGTQTADNAMLSLCAAGSLVMTYQDYGSPGEPNLFITGLADPPDSDTPDYDVDGRYWDYFLGTYSANNVSWTESQYGISGRDFDTGEVVQTLNNGGFYGFYASNDSQPPGLPITTLQLGDFNLDGHVDASDVQAMEAALVNLNGYENGSNSQGATLTAAEMLAIGDVNGDGKTNNADLQALLNLLRAGGGSSASVPEPTSFFLLFVGGFIALCLHINTQRQARSVSETRHLTKESQ